MKVFLNAGFGQALGASVLHEYARLGFAGIRQDMPLQQGTETPLILEFVDHPRLTLLALVNGGKMHHPPHPAARQAAHVARVIRDYGLEERALIELGNEPNIAPEYRKRPDLLAESVREAYAEMRAEGLKTPLVVGGIMTTDKSGLEYLRRVLHDDVPPDVWVGFHTYRTTTSPDMPHDGFASRCAEFRELKQIAGTRPLINTEIGWHTAKSKTGWLCGSVQFNDEEVACFLRREIRINAAYGVEMLTVFQANDGPTEHYEDRFGIRRVDGSWKPSASVAWPA